MTSDGSGMPMMTARDWKRQLARYREPDLMRSCLELLVTGVLFVGLWIATWLSLSVSVLLAMAFGLPAAGCLVRLFIIQHDCGHGSFSGRGRIDDWVGRALGVVTLTPYDVWRQAHAIHHATSGNLTKRGMGDIYTLTVAEYRARPFWRRINYRLYRHPLVMFGVGPAFVFLLQNRVPVGLMRRGIRYWISAMATNVAIAVSASVLIYAVGFGSFLMVHIPITLLAASIGVWLFYVQHQFEETYWADGPTWNQHEAALYGSSHYRLPGVLNWFTGNIGLHHLHHLSSAIPHYRLPEVLRDHPELGEIRRLGLWESLACVSLTLWDEKRQKLVSFRAVDGGRSGALG